MSGIFKGTSGGIAGQYARFLWNINCDLWTAQEVALPYIQDNWTDATLLEKYVGRRIYNPTVPDPIPTADCDEIAVVMLKRVADGQWVRFSFPCPKSTLIIATSNGRRLTASFVEDFRQRLTVWDTTDNYDKGWGYVISKQFV